MDESKWYFNRWLWFAGGVLLALGLGVVVGYYSKPAEIQEKQVIQYVDRVVEKVVTKTDTVQVENKDKIRALKRRIEELTKPDGTTVKVTTEEEGTTEKTNTTEVKTEIKYIDREKIVEKKVEVEKKVKVQPGWLVSAGVGVSVPYLMHKPELGVPGLKGAVIEVGVGRRVVGPFWLGVFGNTQGTVGLSLSGTF